MDYPKRGPLTPPLPASKVGTKGTKTMMGKVFVPPITPTQRVRQ